MAPSLSESIEAVKEGAKEEDRFTYLTILQCHVTRPEILPTLNSVLEQDGKLTQEIGWDLVQMLLDIKDSETCLETVARLGNPREVIIKVMEALESLSGDGQEDEAREGHSSGTVSNTDKFIVLLGMLSILHGRIKTKYPSRFLGSSLTKVLEAYQPTQEMTTAVINLARSLTGRKRPPLPNRKSSVYVTDLAEDGDPSKNAPDPEAEQEDPPEEPMQRKLLQVFVTCVLQRYVNENEMSWAPRLLELYFPKRVVSGRKTITQAYTEDEELHQRDAVVGQLASLAGDLGFKGCSQSFTKRMIEATTGVDPLILFENFNTPDDLHLSPGGCVCLIAYWILSSDIFDAHNPEPTIYIFPHHITLLSRFLGSDPQTEVMQGPGIADALLAIGMGLYHRSSLTESGAETSFMAYHHHLTLISVFHPSLQVRHAATAFAGTMLHADPDAQNRLEILEDLFENCMFASIKACAVTWLKEEVIAAAGIQQKNESSGSFNSVMDTAVSSANVTNPFANASTVDQLQYAIFPDARSLKDMDEDSLLDYWAQNNLFLQQVANFGYILFSAKGPIGDHRLVPAGMISAVEERFVEPLLHMAGKLLECEELTDVVKLDVEMFSQALRSLKL